MRPYLENEIKFIPQLFYKPFFLPFGLQTTQIHLNYWSENEFNKFSNLIHKNREKVVSYDEALKLISSNKTDKIINGIIKKLLIFKRKFKS